MDILDELTDAMDAVVQPTDLGRERNNGLIATVSPATGTAPVTLNCELTSVSGAFTSTPEWSFSDGSFVEGQQVTKTLDIPSDGVAAVAFTENGGGGIRVPIDITRPQNTPPTARTSVSPSSGRAPFTAVFDASDSSDADGQIRSYEWSFSDGATKTGRQVSRRFTAGDIGTITGSCTVTDDDGATDTDAVDVTVQPQPNESPNAVVTTQVSTRR